MNRSDMRGIKSAEDGFLRTKSRIYPLGSKEITQFQMYVHNHMNAAYTVYKETWARTRIGID
jgi:hypothetical protein